LSISDPAQRLLLPPRPVVELNEEKRSKVALAGRDACRGFLVNSFEATEVVMRTTRVDLKELGPIFEQFDWIRQIPRPSKGEHVLLGTIETKAQANGCGTRRDEKNLYVYVPGTSHSSQRMCLMAHADMVCESTQDCPYDPSRDPIPVALWSDEGVEYVVANGFKSTLGADNGIGLAMMMELMTNRAILHPPLDLLITVEEEIGLQGAKAVEPSFIDSTAGINLDSEQEGTQTVATAGMCYSSIQTSLPVRRFLADGQSLHIVVEGLRGGHSGLEIHCRPSAITVLCEALTAALGSYDFLLVSLSGGTACNAIPICAVADIALPTEAAISCAGLLRQFGEKTLVELGEKAATVDVQMRPQTCEVIGMSPHSVLGLMNSVPVGALSFNEQLPGRPVEQSNNLWCAKIADGTMRLDCSSRAMSNSGLDEILKLLQKAAIQHGSTFELGADSRFPPWEPNPNSSIQRAVAESYHRLAGKPMQPLAVHGGLELSLIQAKFQTLGRQFDTTSIGPNIFGAHTVHERVDVGSVGRVFQLLCDVLARW
jgi:dipeptidase D